MDTILNLFSNLGVPVACLICLGWFFKYYFDKTQDEETRHNDQLISLMEKHKEESDALKEAINNNTVALTKLAERLGQEV